MRCSVNRRIGGRGGQGAGERGQHGNLSNFFSTLWKVQKGFDDSHQHHRSVTPITREGDILRQTDASTSDGAESTAAPSISRLLKRRASHSRPIIRGSRESQSTAAAWDFLLITTKSSVGTRRLRKFWYHQCTSYPIDANVPLKMGPAPPGNLRALFPKSIFKHEKTPFCFNPIQIDSTLSYSLGGGEGNFNRTLA